VCHHVDRDAERERKGRRGQGPGRGRGRGQRGRGPPVPHRGHARRRLGKTAGDKKTSSFWRDREEEREGGEETGKIFFYRALYIIGG